MTPFEECQADALAKAVAALIGAGTISSRSPAADALLDYKDGAFFCRPVEQPPMDSRRIREVLESVRSHIGDDSDISVLYREGYWAAIKANTLSLLRLDEARVLMQELLSQCEGYLGPCICGGLMTRTRAFLKRK